MASCAGLFILCVAAWFVGFNIANKKKTIDRNQHYCLKGEKITFRGCKFNFVVCENWNSN